MTKIHVNCYKMELNFNYFRVFHIIIVEAIDDTINTIYSSEYILKIPFALNTLKRTVIATIKFG